MSMVLSHIGICIALSQTIIFTALGHTDVWIVLRHIGICIVLSHAGVYEVWVKLVFALVPSWHQCSLGAYEEVIFLGNFKIR